MNKLSVGLLMINFTFVYLFSKLERYVVSQLKSEHNFTLENVGMISSSSALGYLAGKFSGGLLSDRLDPVLLYLTSNFAVAIFVLLATFLFSLELLICCFFVVGFFSGSVFPQIAKILKANIEPSVFGTVYTAFGASYGLVGISIPVILPLFGDVSWVVSARTFIVIHLMFLSQSWLSFRKFNITCKSLNRSVKTSKDEKNESQKSDPNIGNCDNVGTGETSGTNLVTVVCVIGSIGFLNRVCRFSLDWYKVIDKERYSPSVVSLQQFGCMTGSLLSGFVTDFVLKLQTTCPNSAIMHYFDNPRILLFIALQILNGLSFSFMGVSNQLFVYVFNLLFGLTIDAAYYVGSIIVVELVNPSQIGLALALVSLPCTFGSFTAGYPVTVLGAS